MMLVIVFVVALLLGLLGGGLLGHPFGVVLALIGGPLRRRWGRLRGSTVLAVVGTPLVALAVGAVVFALDLGLSPLSFHRVADGEAFYAREMLAVSTCAAVVSSGVIAFGTSWALSALLGVPPQRGGVAAKAVGGAVGACAGLLIMAAPMVLALQSGVLAALAGLAGCGIAAADGFLWGWLIVRRVQFGATAET